MMVHVLDVSTNGVSVGKLAFESVGRQYSFTYDNAWEVRRDAFALSPHIPLGVEQPQPGVVERFVGNLLPEGGTLEVAATMFQVSKDNIYALIHFLGKEPAGALCFQGADEAAGAYPVRREISREELSERIRTRDEIPFPVWDGQVRLSIAGYQDKLQVLLEGDSLSLAGGTLSSTHILKPESRNPRTPFMVANEHFCMTLAAKMGLPVAPVTIRRIPEAILLVERFDRVVEHEFGNPQRVATVKRVHIIDGCQAMDLPPIFKYERNLGNHPDVRHIRDGASFEKLFALTPHLETPAETLTHMIRWAILQMLIGNSDAHAKNISFFVNAGGLSPAPLYDLVCVNVYGNAYVQDMAMAYGDVFRLEELTAFAMADFAHRTKIRPALLSRELTRMAKAAMAVAPELAASEMYKGEEKAFVQRISDFVRAQAERVLRLAPMVPRVDKSLL